MTRTTPPDRHVHGFADCCWRGCTRQVPSTEQLCPLHRAVLTALFDTTPHDTDTEEIDRYE